MRTIKIKAKCDDKCAVAYKNYHSNGYAPSHIGIGGGDYIELEIDLDTGQILNWKVPDEETVIGSIESM